MLSVICGAVWGADGWTITKLSDNVYTGIYQVSGKNVVWLEFFEGDNELFFYDGNDITQLTDNNYNDLVNWDEGVYKNISGNKIVWQATVDSNNVIFIYDGNSATELVNDSAPKSRLNISGTIVTWVAGYGPLELYYAKPNPPENCDEAQLIGYSLDGDCNKDCRVDLDDFAILAGNWLNCIEPDDPNCTHPWE